MCSSLLLCDAMPSHAHLLPMLLSKRRDLCVSCLRCRFWEPKRKWKWYVVCSCGLGLCFSYVEIFLVTVCCNWKCHRIQLHLAHVSAYKCICIGFVHKKNNCAGRTNDNLIGADNWMLASQAPLVILGSPGKLDKFHRNCQWQIERRRFFDKCGLPCYCFHGILPARAVSVDSVDISMGFLWWKINLLLKIRQNCLLKKIFRNIIKFCEKSRAESEIIERIFQTSLECRLPNSFIIRLLFGYVAYVEAIKRPSKQHKTDGNLSFFASTNTWHRWWYWNGYTIPSLSPPGPLCAVDRRGRRRKMVFDVRRDWKVLSVCVCCHSERNQIRNKYKCSLTKNTQTEWRQKKNHHEIWSGLESHWVQSIVKWVKP